MPARLEAISTMNIHPSTRTIGALAILLAALAGCTTRGTDGPGQNARFIGRGDANHWTFTAPTAGLLYLVHSGEVKYTWGLQAGEKLVLEGRIPEGHGSIELSSKDKFFFEPLSVVQEHSP